MPAVIGIDTRHLVHLIRSKPNLKGRIEPEESKGYRDFGNKLTPANPTAFFDPSAQNIIDQVSTKERVVFLEKARRELAYRHWS